MKTDNVNFNNPYKMNGKGLVVMVTCCFLVVITIAYGLAYLESTLVAQQVDAVSLEEVVTLNDYTTNNYLGQFGKTYTVGVPSFEIQYDLDLLTYYN